MNKSQTPKPIRLEDLTPGYLLHPGEMLKDELEARGISQVDLAKRLDMSRSQLNEHIHGKRDFTTELCLLVAKALQMDEVIWLNLKRNYEVDKVKIEQRTKEKLAAVGERPFQKPVVSRPLQVKDEMATYQMRNPPVSLENGPQLGTGIFTPKGIAHILRLPVRKVEVWIREYWDGKLANAFPERYSWKINGAKAVSFHTFIELYVMMQLNEAGAKPRKILEAHRQLSQKYGTPFPFAQREVLEGLNTDGGGIYHSDVDDNILTLDGTRQLNVGLIKQFFKKLDFGAGDLASRFWPMGKDHSIVIDPERKFGHAVIGNTNVYPETIADLHNAGDPIAYLATIYELTEAQVSDAIAYCSAA